VERIQNRKNIQDQSKKGKVLFKVVKILSINVVESNRAPVAIYKIFLSNWPMLSFNKSM
jgi:hypothetical protein